MADVTIQNSVGVTFTFNQGEIDSVRSLLAADVEQITLPIFGPSESLLFDFNGVSKVISIKGTLWSDGTNRLSSGTATTILAQKQFLEQNLNGFQTAVTFSSTYEAQTFNGTSYATTKVMWGRIEFNEIAGNPEELGFSATLLVGAA